MDNSLKQIEILKEYFDRLFGRISEKQQRKMKNSKLFFKQGWFENRLP